MRAQVTWKGWLPESDTISIFDDDNREIAIHRDQIPDLMKLLKAIEKREFGKLGLEVIKK